MTTRSVPNSTIPWASRGTDKSGPKKKNGYSSSFYQLSVENGIFKWEKMKPELKIPRSDFVAMTIPDHLVDVQPLVKPSTEVTLHD